ncbi:MAG: hypothetical protein HC878_11450 [Leptolyngbyaceae cyanobacterium SL_5_14]|nr:hypothetical protein [Leptolyngbyaceae cyanobacterium SL_5_14]
MCLLTWHRCLSDQTLERWIDQTGFVAVTLGKLALETFTPSLSFWTTHELMAVPIRVLWLRFCYGVSSGQRL